MGEESVDGNLDITWEKVKMRNQIRYLRVIRYQGWGFLAKPT